MELVVKKCPYKDKVICSFAECEGYPNQPIHKNRCCLQCIYYENCQTRCLNAVDLRKKGYTVLYEIPR